MKEVKVQYCPPGRAEGASFQRFSHDRYFANVKATDVFIPGDETPANISLLTEINASAMSLREIITEGGDD